MTATMLLCIGCFVAGVGFGGLLGMLVTRADARVGRPDVTAWGETTAQWSETDWDWWEHCGRFNDPEMVGKIRRYRPDLPPPTDYVIDRSPKAWWTC